MADPPISEKERTRIEWFSPEVIPLLDAIQELHERIVLLEVSIGELGVLPETDGGEDWAGA